MATTGTVLAKNMAIYINGSPDTVISCQVDATLTLSTATFETTCKDAGSWAEPRPGTKSWTMSGTGNLAFDATYGYEELFGLWYNQTETAFVISTGVTGDKQQYGDGYVTELEMTSSGNDAAVTFSFTVTGAGALIMSTVS